MVHEVRADGVVLVEGEGELELGADAVHGGDEDGLFVFLEIEREQAAEAADLPEHFFAVRAGEELRERGFDFIPEININAGSGVSFLLLHVARIKPKNGEAGEKISRG